MSEPAGKVVTYKVIRIFKRGKRMVIKTGLTRAQAEEHCRNPETSSKTATGMVERTLTRNFGDWFDGFEAE